MFTRKILENRSTKYLKQLLRNLHGWTDPYSKNYNKNVDPAEAAEASVMIDDIVYHREKQHVPMSVTIKVPTMKSYDPVSGDYRDYTVGDMVKDMQNGKRTMFDPQHKTHENY